jgi:predicted aspartyl protease
MARRLLQGTLAHIPALILALALNAVAMAHVEAPVSTHANPAAAGTVEPPAETKPEDFIYVAATEPDRIGRVMAPVFVNGVGPFAFVVDTGASSTVIAPRVARRLALPLDTENTKLLRGITGSEIVPTVTVRDIAAGGIRLANVNLPVVEPRVFADADGIFGADAFARGCLVVNFARARIVVLEKPCPRVDDSWEVMRARVQFGGLVVVDGRVGKTPVVAIIDTGAEQSLGNFALLETLKRSDKKANRAENRAEVFAATSHSVFGELVQTPAVRVGKLRIGNLPVVYGDFEVFKIWDVQEQPAIVLGIDVLGVSEAMMIDYTRSELRVLPKFSGVSMKTRGTPSRLPRN